MATLVDMLASRRPELKNRGDEVKLGERGFEGRAFVNRPYSDGPMLTIIIKLPSGMYVDFDATREAYGAVLKRAKLSDFYTENDSGHFITYKRGRYTYETYVPMKYSAQLKWEFPFPEGAVGPAGFVTASSFQVNSFELSEGLRAAQLLFGFYSENKASHPKARKLNMHVIRRELAKLGEIKTIS